LGNCFRFLASLIAVFGEYDISGELESKRSVSRSVRRVIVHRYYDAATFENDIALLELEAPVQFDQHIVPICMPKDDDDFTGRMASVTGWGRLKYGTPRSPLLSSFLTPSRNKNGMNPGFRWWSAYDPAGGPGARH
jgi:secreted trypsin-like serine protease